MAAIYGDAERQAKKLGSLGSVTSLIAAIGGGRSSEAGAGMSTPKKKKRKKPAGGGTSDELQKMLSANYERKGQKVMMGQ